MLDLELPDDTVATDYIAGPTVKTLITGYPNVPPPIWPDESLKPHRSYGGYIAAVAFGIVLGLLLADSSLFNRFGRRDDNQEEKQDRDDKQSSAKLANAYVILIEETAERKPEVARLLGNSDYWDSLGARKIKWRAYDKDSPNAESYREAADKVGLPAVLILTKEANQDKATLVAAKPAPPTTDLLDEWIRKVTGL